MNVYTCCVCTEKPCTCPNSTICVQFGEVHLDPCAFDYKFDDWVKLTLPFGVKLILDEPLVGMFYQLL